MTWPRYDYVVEFTEWGLIEHEARRRGWDGDAMDCPTGYLDDREIRDLRQERECATLDEVFAVLGQPSHLYGEVTITRRKYCPGLYLHTDWEPQESWTVEGKIKSARDLRRPRKARAA